MKTNLEWYQELPEPFKSQAITNCTNYEGGRKLHTPSDYFYNAIGSGFEWMMTPEGHDYWHDLYNRLCRIQRERNTRSSPL